MESNILTEADIANSATQFLVDIQLMPFVPRLGDFLPPPDPNSYVLQTDDEIKKVTKQATAKKFKKKRKTFSGSNNGNSTSQSSLNSAETEEVVLVSEDVQKNHWRRNHSGQPGSTGGPNSKTLRKLNQSFPR